ncbi:MAG: ribonuclease R [Syntrophobacterales bacterium]|nr:ribonuclease R [Syntrophobacterales bacterium]
MNQQQELTPGTVVEFYHEKNICTGVILGTKGQRLFVLSDQNREMNISQGRILETVGPTLDIRADRDKLVASLREISAKREELAAEIDIEDLWGLLEEEGGSYSLRELASFLFNDLDVHHLSALERALLTDKFYFQKKDGLHIPRSKEAVEQLRIQVEREALKERTLEEGSSWLREIWKTPGVVSQELSSQQQDIVEKLKDFAIAGNESEHYEFIKELFKRADLNTDPLVALQLLVNIGIWKADENILIRKFEIPRYFSENLLAYAETLVMKTHHDPVDEKREDLRHLWTVSIDSEETKDIDDAISLERLDPNTFRIGIHITDVASYVPPGDPLDIEARSRMTSIYLPDEKIPMLPTIISENLCSLIANEDKRAISFLLTVDRQGSVMETQIKPSFIRVKERLSYEEVTRRIQGGDEHFKVLYEITYAFREDRKSRGAIVLHLPEVYATVDSDGTVHIKKYDREEQSQVIVSECMIAANTLAAKFFAERNTPALYRIQGETKQENDSYGDVHPLFTLMRQRRLFAKAELSTTPERHCSLGVECYSSITSPIRRYMDLVLQRQLRACLIGTLPPYSIEDLEAIITEMNSTLPKVFQVTRRWNRYWILRYIEQENIKNTTALILDHNDRSIHIVLPDFMLEAFIPKKSNRSFVLGQLVPAKIERVKPREESIMIVLNTN